MSDLSADLQAGLSDRYTIDREPGRGGMATVYLARDLRHDRLVALRLVHSTVEGRGLETRFQHEIRMSARFTHPTSSPSSTRAKPPGISGSRCRVRQSARPWRHAVIRGNPRVGTLIATQ